MNDEGDDPELEFSPLGGHVTRDGITVQVLIYRIAGSDDGWALEVEDDEGTSTTWDETFPTEAEALAEFNRIVEESGMLSFLADDEDETQH